MLYLALFRLCIHQLNTCSVTSSGVSCTQRRRSMATLTTETITSEYFELFLWFFGFIRLLFVFFLEDFISLADKNGWTALHGAASEGTDSI